MKKLSNRINTFNKRLRLHRQSTQLEKQQQILKRLIQRSEQVCNKLKEDHDPFELEVRKINLTLKNRLFKSQMHEDDIFLDLLS